MRTALTLALALAAVPAAAQPSPLVAHVRAHPDGRAPWSVELAALAGERAALPVGVFDSGIGGLTVLEAILALDRFHNDTLAPGADGRPDFAGERFLYLGDQANMPYGNYPAAGREAYLRELVLKDAVFLLGTRWREAASAPPRHDKPPVKAIVIACNTATAYGLEDVRAALAAWKLDAPVIGVVEAGARTLAAELPKGGTPSTVAVMATAGTCASGAYPRAIAAAAGKLGKPAPPVVQQGSSALAGAIEGNRAYVGAAVGEREAPYAGPTPDPALAAVYGFDAAGMRGSELNSVANHVRYEAATLLEAQRRAGGPPIGSIVLGCTHYPLVRDELAAALAAVRAYRAPDGEQPYAATVAADVRFVDPAEATARELFVALATARLRAPGAREAATAPSATFFISVPNPAAPGVRLAADGALDAAYRTGRATGRFNLEDTVAVPLTAATLPPSSAQLVRALPHVWQALAATGQAVEAGRAAAPAIPDATQAAPPAGRMRST
jgi:glutamate racemase